ncbi:MAG: hypothetical protein ACP5VR_04075 [Acidimicrobiales bacterium]
MDVRTGTYRPRGGGDAQGGPSRPLGGHNLLALVGGPSARPMLARSLVVLQFSAFLVWAYVAALAVLAPQDLPRRLDGTVPLRADTTGALAFSTSVLLALVGTLLYSQAEPIARLRRFASLVCANGSLYCWAGWLYISCNSITHPYTLHLPLTHLLAWPDEGTFAVACLVSGVVLSVGAAVLFAGHRRLGRA